MVQVQKWHFQEWTTFWPPRLLFWEGNVTCMTGNISRFPPLTYHSNWTCSDDCGVFVAKWAQHISVGLPLDFSHPDIVNFRYSLILDIARNALSMDIKVPSTQTRKETLKRTTAASSQMSTTSTPHRVSMTNETSVSDKVTPATSPINQASAAKQTSLSNKAGFRF